MRTVMVTRRVEISGQVRRSLRCLLAVLAFVACDGRAADDPEKAQQRDGVWLRNGIDQYERLNAHESLSENDANDALVVRSYVCAIVDLEEYLVLRANLLDRAVGDARKQHHINPQKLNGMAEALPILVPLMQTKFSTDSPPCDKVVLMVRDYLGKYPEMLTKDSDIVIEKALLEAYSNINES
jgi:hypothetical protein